MLAAVEQDIVGLLTECLGLELQNGHTEQAIACIQAALEFNFFSPHFDGKVLLSMPNLHPFSSRGLFWQGSDIVLLYSV